MASIEIINQASPVLSTPNVGAAGARSGGQTTPAPAEQAVQGQEKNVSAAEVSKAVAQANVEFSGSKETIGFGYEEKLGQLYVQVKDKASGEVIREIPSRDFIRHRIAMREMIGLILDKQA
jgi:flagellar protein FlaG